VGGEDEALHEEVVNNGTICPWFSTGMTGHAAIADP